MTSKTILVEKGIVSMRLAINFEQLTKAMLFVENLLNSEDSEKALELIREYKKQNSTTK